MFTRLSVKCCISVLCIQSAHVTVVKMVTSLICMISSLHHVESRCCLLPLHMLQCIIAEIQIELIVFIPVPTDR